MIDVVALGELLIDFAPVSTDDAGYPTLKAQPGGAPGNFLAALQKYGCSTALLGKVGNDTFGHLLVGTLDSLGIDTRGIVADPAVFTTLAFVTLDATGNRSFSFARKPGADTCLRAGELDYRPAGRLQGLSLRLPEPDRRARPFGHPGRRGLRQGARQAHQL